MLFMHGHGGAAWLWRKVLDLVAAEGFRAIAIDLPGHGESDSPPEEVDLTRPSRFLVAFLDALGLERAVLVGGSLGGYVALCTALETPHRVPALALVGPAGIDRRVGLVYRLLTVPVLGEILARPTMGMGRRDLRRILWDRSYVTDQFIRCWLQRRREPGGVREFLRILRVGVNLLGIKRSLLLEPLLSTLSQPVLLLWGAGDRVIPTAVGLKALRLMPHAELRIFDRCGHWPYVERSSDFSRALVPFLRAHAYTDP